MSETRGKTRAERRATRAGNYPSLPCSACGATVDPLRAPRVSVFNGRFHYFCSPACHEEFAQRPSAEWAKAISFSVVPSSPSSVPASPSSVPVLGDELPPEPSSAPLTAPLAALALPPTATAATHSSPASTRPSVASGAPHPPSPVDAATSRHSQSPARASLAPDRLSLAPERAAWPPPPASEPTVARPALPGQRQPELQLAAACGAAGLATELAWGLAAPPWLAPVLSAVACAALSWSVWRRHELVWRGPALFGLLPPLVATLTALVSLLLEGRAAAPAASVAAAICFSAASSLLLISRQQDTLRPLRERLADALRGSAPRALAGGGALELRPGEEFVLETGDRSPADAVIVAGKAEVEPWFEASARVPRQEGEMLLAGGRVLHGSLRAVVRWAGMDRAWARLTLDPDRRADRHASPARVAERLCTSGALLLASLAAVLAFSARPGATLALSSAAAVAAALCSVALPELIALQLASGVHQLLGRGISFRGPEALDRAARTTRVVFCAEGTLFADEPSVASIEPSAPVGSSDLLALVAGAFAGVSSPLAAALVRCAQSYQVRPDATRSPNHSAGLGVTAVASSGQSLVVGTRALLLGRHISVAGAETRIAELEALGRSVLLAALDGRYVGLVAVQDAVAPGGRAAVQRLLDAGVEPILLSGAARDTCQALARHLGLEHIRPEVLPEDRPAELRRLVDTAPALAVVGRSSKDDAVLGVAPLSINVDGASGPLERWDIDVASGDVRDAAWAVHLARRLYADTTRSTFIASAPALLALLFLIVGLPPWLAPLTGALGTALALRQSRTPASPPGIRPRAPAASS
ncbi:MAG: hypothetical protein RL033_6029 [Pseudomonadota bacterium]